VSTLGETRHKFATEHRHISIHRILWTDFEMQTMIADFKSIRRRIDDMVTNDEPRDDHRDASIDTMSSSDFSDDDSIEVVHTSMDLFAILCTEVVQLW